MGGLTTEYCVEIRVPKKNSDKNKFGTGYTLGPHWVLTAYHVLFGDDVDAGQPIKITWRDTWRDEIGDQVEGGKQLSVNRDNIVWYHQEHDIALIRFEPPYKNVPGAWEELAQENAEWQDFRSAGFLSNLHDEAEKQRRVTPEGSLGGCSEGENKIDLNNPTVNLHDNEDWAGFSGSPVFVKNKLVAVVRTVKTGENSLTASFISTALDSKGEGPDQPVLRDIPDFLIAPTRKKCWERVQQKVADALTDTVYKALKKDYQDKINSEAKINNSAALAELLFREENIKVIKLFSRVSTAMRKQQQVQEVCIMKDLASIWLVLMAAEQGNICGAEEFKENASAQSLDIKAVEPVLLDVEAQAANA
ncbi:MAG: serine protease, partial [Candidatus Electrothrix sp. AR3]|nr:serine protease [Candidatus Electrothrix sp. AR3]